MGNRLNATAIVGLEFAQRQLVTPRIADPLERGRPLVAAVGTRGFEIRAAHSWRERSDASLLINKLYGNRGYKNMPLPTEVDASQLTLVANDQGTVVGTLSVGFDVDDRLLADETFPDEINALRNSGRQVCEFTKFAADGLICSQQVLAAMFHVAFIQAHRIRGCDNLLIEVNPRHTRFYKSKLGFVDVGPERLNHRVNAPAVLLSLDLWQTQQKIRTFGGKPELSATERTLFPFGFSVDEEAGIAERLREQEIHSHRISPFGLLPA